MIIVAYLRTQVVRILFGGRDSGQKEWKMRSGVSQNARPARVENNVMDRSRQLLRFGSWITTSSETASTQVCPSNWMRSAE